MKKIFVILIVVLSTRAHAQKIELFLFQSLDSVSFQKMKKPAECLTNREKIYEDDSFIVYKSTFVIRKNSSKKAAVKAPIENFEFVYYFIDFNDGDTYHKYFFAKAAKSPTLKNVYLVTPYRLASLNFSKGFIRFQNKLFDLSEEDYLKDPPK